MATLEAQPCLFEKDLIDVFQPERPSFPPACGSREPPKENPSIVFMPLNEKWSFERCDPEINRIGLLRMTRPPPLCRVPATNTERTVMTNTFAS